MSWVAKGAGLAQIREEAPIERTRTNEDTPVVAQVIAFEELPLAVRFSRRAVVEWSDGTVGEAARWWHDEVLLTEGDLNGATHAAIQEKIHRRDVGWLQS